MDAKELYERLDKDFDLDNLNDDWSFMDFNPYISSDFKKRYMGIMLDNSAEVNKVFTATIPDRDIIEKLIHSGHTDVLLFSHHAMGYDPTMEGFPFYNIPAEFLPILRNRRISLYVLHLPLDKNGEYSTSVTLARNLNLEIADEFCEYQGIKCGVICQTNLKTLSDLGEHISSVIGHEVKLILNGDDRIHDGRVAIAAGGGSVDFAAKEIAELGINTYVTGNTRRVPMVEPVREFHRICEEKKINVIGATHYSTEKYACMEMARYFEELGIQAEFIAGRYFFEDL